MSRRRAMSILIVLGCLLIGTTPIPADNWPAWRGPRGTGVVEEGAAAFPTKWSAEKNVKWKVDLPAPGNSTPVVWGDKVFVTGASESGTERGLYCYHRDTGRQLWHVKTEFAERERTHRTNPQCSSSPITDGERVIVWHGSAGVFCYDLDGKPLWKTPLGKFTHIWGTGSSPAFYKDLVILNCGPGLEAFVVALNKKTGKQVWRRDLPNMKSEKFDEFHGSWSTPVFYRTNAGDDLLLLSLPLKLYALEPTTGEEVWSCGGLTKLVYTSPLVGDDAIVAMSGYHGHALAVRRGGAGDVTDSHRLWHHTERKQIPQRVGSGVVVGKHIYILNENGVAWCLDLKTGAKRWEERLGGRSWSSMCRVGDRLYALNMQGTTFVLEVNPDACKVLSRNQLGGETTRGSLAFSNGQIFVRSYDRLYCIEGAK